MPTKPKNLPEPFRAEHRSRVRQYVAGIVIIFAAVLMLIAENMPVAGIMFLLLVLITVGGAVWVGGPGRQYDRARLQQGLRD